MQVLIDLQPIKLGISPIIVLLALIVAFAVLDVSLPVFDAPVLQAVFNFLFLTIPSISVAVVAAKSFLKYGALSILLLSNALVIIGVGFLISTGLILTLTDYGVTVQVAGLFASAILQVLTAIVTPTTASLNERFRRNFTLGVTYFISIGSLGFVTYLLYSLKNLISNAPIILPLFNQSLLSLAFFLFSSSGILFFWQYLKSKSEALYWISLALLSLGIGCLSFVFQTQTGDVYSWLSSISMYIGSFYFIIALYRLNITNQKKTFMRSGQNHLFLTEDK